jgi:hypothetical protein
LFLSAFRGSDERIALTTHTPRAPPLAL